MRASSVPAASALRSDSDDEARFRALVDATPAMLWSTRGDGTCDYVNPAWLAFTGRTLAEELGAGWFDAVHEDDRAAVALAYDEASARRAPLAVEFRLRARDGTWRWLRSTCTPRLAADGTLLGYAGCCVEVTERHAAESALRRQATQLARSDDAVRQSESRLRRIAEADIVGLFYWTLAGGITEANDAFLRMLGFDRADLAAGRVDWRALTPPEYATRDEAKVAELLATGRHGPYAKAYVARDGRQVPVLVASALFDYSRDEGVCVCIDLSEQKRVEAELAEHEARFRRAMQTVRAVAVWLDLDGRVTFANDFLLELTGWTRDEVIGESWFERFVPHEATVEAMFREHIARGEIFPYFENEIATRDGARRVIAWDNTVLRDGAGRVIGTASIGRDVTAERAMQAALSETVARERATFARAGVAMARLSLDGLWLEVNDQLCAFLGRPREALLGRSFVDVTHPDDVAIGRDAMREMARGAREQVTAEKRYVRPDGSVRWGRATAALVRDEMGAPTYRVTVIEDITEERRAQAARERALRHARVLQSLTAAFASALTREEVARVVNDVVADAVGAHLGVLAVLAPDGVSLDVAAVERLGVDDAGGWRSIPLDAPVPLSEAVRTGTKVVIVGDEEIARRFPAVAGAARAHGTRALLALPVPPSPRATNGGRAAVTTAAHVGALGLSFPTTDAVDLEALSLATAAARLCAQAIERAALYEAAEAARGEAERRRIEAEQANRTKSNFLAVMSHELRTPLNAIAGYVELLELGIRGPLTDEQRADLARVKRSQRHLLALIDEVLTFSKLEAEQMTLSIADVPLSALFDEVAEVIEPQVRERGLRFETFGVRDGLAVRGDPDRVRQILLNLLSNAIKFTDPWRGGVQGRVTLGVETSERTLRLSVTDTGCGIAHDRLDDVFHPFVQLEGGLTRRREGTGLGLAISRDLARAMGGDVTVESRVGVGTTFTLSLPRVAHVA